MTVLFVTACRREDCCLSYFHGFNGDQAWG